MRNHHLDGEATDLEAVIDSRHCEESRLFLIDLLILSLRCQHLNFSAVYHINGVVPVPLTDCFSGR